MLSTRVSVAALSCVVWLEMCCGVGLELLHWPVGIAASMLLASGIVSA